MADPRYAKWANALTGYSAEVLPGNTVAILGGSAAEPLLLEIYRSVLERGGFPVLVPTLPGTFAAMLGGGTDDQIDFLTPVERFARLEADVVISVVAETNTRSLSGVDPSRQSRFQKARSDLMKQFLERETSGDMRWTLTLFPTPAHAQDAEMATDEFADFVMRGCKLHEDDPVAAWKKQGAEQQKLVDFLTPHSEIHVTGPGTDLTLSTAGRTWINCDGEKNFPDGEVFTAPLEDSVNGRVRFSYPAVVSGREVSGIELTFADGRVVAATAEKGEDLLLAQLDTDEGARVLGEFAFGTNFDIQRFSKNILFDEKIGGTIHMAVGATYPDSGGANQSAIHWDMVCDLREGGKVTVDGEPFLVDGMYVVQ